MEGPYRRGVLAGPAPLTPEEARASRQRMWVRVAILAVALLGAALVLGVRP